MGTAAVHDKCGTVGPILTSPIMTFPPGGFSTWKPPPASELPGNDTSYEVGNVWDDPFNEVFSWALDYFQPLTIKDLACPTWGLGTGTSADGTVITTIGPPWLPIIKPPMEAFSLDPAWVSMCTGMLTDLLRLESFDLYDPPIALTRSSGLLPSPVVPLIPSTTIPRLSPADPTTVPERHVPYSTVAAKPANSAVDPADPPARTGDPGRDSSSPSLAVASAAPARPASPSGDSVATPTNKSDPPAQPQLPEHIIPAVSAASKYPPAPSFDVDDPASPASNGDPPPTPKALASSSINPINGLGDLSVNLKVSKPDSTQTAPADAKPPAQPAPQKVDSSQPLTQGLGAMIYNAFGKSGPEVGGTSNEVNTILVPTAGIQEVSIGEGQLLSVNPSGFTSPGMLYSIDGPVMTLSNSVYTLVAQHGSGNTAADNTQSLGDSLPVDPEVWTIVGQTVVPNTTRMVIAGSDVFSGGDAVRVSNTPISLAPSGILVIGSSSFPLPPQSVLATSPQSFVADPTELVLNGATVYPGGAAQTTDGTLALSSTTISLLTSSSASLAMSALTVAGQTFTPNPTAFPIASTTITAGGPAVTVAGTVIRLQTSGTLIIGSSTIALLAPQTPLPSLPYTDGLSVEAQSSLAIVDGVTISPGAPGVTVDGSVVSLEAGGATLDVGTGRFVMPTAGADGPGGVVAFEGGQEKGVEVSLLLVLLFGIGGVLMALLR